MITDSGITDTARFLALATSRLWCLVEGEHNVTRRRVRTSKSIVKVGWALPTGTLSARLLPIPSNAQFLSQSDSPGRPQNRRKSNRGDQRGILVWARGHGCRLPAASVPFNAASAGLPAIRPLPQC
jgi:hypothetical protein